MAGVSHGTLDKVKKLDADADKATKEKLRSGEISTHKAYTELVNKQHEGETRMSPYRRVFNNLPGLPPRCHAGQTVEPGLGSRGECMRKTRYTGGLQPA